MLKKKERGRSNKCGISLGQSVGTLAMVAKCLNLVVFSQMVQ